MPLNTRVIRNGEALKIPWGHFHIACMVIAAAVDSGKGPFSDNSRGAVFGSDDPERTLGVGSKDTFALVSYPVIGTTPLNEGEYTLKSKYVFGDMIDGEVFELLPGDTLIAYRN